jgi:serine/threonine protein phosphatase PrpC
VSRVCAILGVARALGDTFLQPMVIELREILCYNISITTTQQVTCVPDVFEIKLDEYDVLIMACDGLWDVVTDREASIVALSVSDAGKQLLFTLIVEKKSLTNLSQYNRRCRS